MMCIMSHDSRSHVLSFKLYIVTRCCVTGNSEKVLSPGSDNEGLMKLLGIPPESDDHRGPRSRDVPLEVETNISDGRSKV
jgi:hypothetical protein